MSVSILIVEDEEDLATLLRYNLEAKGFEVFEASDGELATQLLQENPPDLILLDWMLPQISGIELCRRWRKDKKTSSIPIIMLTARGEETDRVRGFATGADDYVVKPFSVLELLARIDALLRRTSPKLLSSKIIAGDIELDRENFRVLRAGKEIHLGPKEYRLLEFFMSHVGRVHSREKLLNNVWGADVYIDDRTVDVHIARLRKSLTENKSLTKDKQVDPIRTVRGAGYAFDEKF